MKLKDEEKLNEVCQSPNICITKVGWTGYLHRQSCQGSLAWLSPCYHKPPYASHMTLKFPVGGSRQPHSGEPRQLLKQDPLFSDFSEASLKPANNAMHPALPKMLPDSLDFSTQCLP